MTERKTKFGNISKQLKKIEHLDGFNRLVMLGCLVVSFHSLAYINTDKHLRPVHYAGYTGSISSFVYATRLQKKKQKYEDMQHKLQREG